MGNWFQVIVDRDVSLAEAQPLAVKILERLIHQDIIRAELSDDYVLNGTEIG